MEYTSVAEAENLQGLRLVLTQGVPGPWSEAAKAIFTLRHVPYTPVVQKGGRDNPELLAWTRHRNAPIALYKDEAPRVRAMEIIDLAERLGSGASLVPSDRQSRMFMVGLINELAGERGFAWNARLLMLHAGAQAQGIEAIKKNPMYADYQYDADSITDTKIEVEGLLSDLAKHIKSQRDIESDYLIGKAFTAADVYWAYFSNMLQALPPEVNPMPEGLLKSWGILASTIGDYDPVLIEQRDHIFEKHLVLPLTF